MTEQVDLTIAATQTFTDAVRAGDLEGAKAAYAPSRQGWERIEPIAGLVEEIDGAVDARVDDFEGVGAYRLGDGYRPYDALTDEHRTEMQTTLAELSEHLATVAGVLGLEG